LVWWAWFRTVPVLVIAEGEKADLERFAEALRIENTYIHVQDISIEFSPGLGEFSNFRKISGPDEIGERLDDGIEILKQNDLKTYMDMRFERIETDLAELKELKTALKEKGFI
jgi:hypothetical protein